MTTVTITIAAIKTVDRPSSVGFGVGVTVDVGLGDGVTVVGDGVGVVIGVGVGDSVGDGVGVGVGDGAQVTLNAVVVKVTFSKLVKSYSDDTLYWRSIAEVSVSLKLVALFEINSTLSFVILAKYPLKANPFFVTVR
jgi:hypothetical protein